MLNLITEVAGDRGIGPGAVLSWSCIQEPTDKRYGFLI